MVLIKDGNNAESFDISNKEVKHNESIEINLLPKGGASIFVVKDVKL